MALDDCIAAGLAWRDGVLTDERVTAAEIAIHAANGGNGGNGAHAGQPGQGANGDHPAYGTVVWVDLLNPTRADLEELADRLDLPDATVEDVIAPHERPKVTRHGRHVFFTVYTAQLRADAADPLSGRVHSERMSGLVLPNVLVTIRLDDSFDMAPIVARWEENADLISYGVGALVHGLLDAVVDGHFDAIQQLDSEVEELEDALFVEEQTGREFAQRVYRFRKDLVALRRLVLPMREVVNAILRHRGRDGSELDHWYDDLYDHVLRASEWTESLRDMATTVFETNLSLTDSRLNIVMKKLAGWGAIIAIPTAVTGWFGQNVPYPGFAQPLGMWLSIILIVTIAGGLYVSFKARDWL